MFSYPRPYFIDYPFDGDLQIDQVSQVLPAGPVTLTIWDGAGKDYLIRSASLSMFITTALTNVIIEAKILSSVPLTHYFDRLQPLTAGRWDTMLTGLFLSNDMTLQITITNNAVGDRFSLNHLHEIYKSNGAMII